MTPAWMDVTQYVVTPFALQTFLVSAAIFALGAIVLLREKWSTEGILFWLCTISIGIWLFSFSCMYSSPNADLALFWARAAYLGVPFIPSAIFHFTVVMLRAPQYRRRVILYWLLSACFSFTIVTTDFLIPYVQKYKWGYYPQYGRLALPYLCFFFGVMLETIVHFWFEARRAPAGTIARTRARHLLVAFVIAYAASIDYLPKFGVPIYPVGYIFIFCFLLLASNTIWQYRLIDITPAFAADKILETMSEPVIVCDLDGRVRIANPAFERTFGYVAAEVQGSRVGDFISDGEWHPQVRGEQVKNHECLFRAKNGSGIFVDLSASMLTSVDGRPQGHVIVARDIREAKRLEHELKSFNETLEEGVQKRTKELATKIQELEWLNTVMMGREERILELKEQLRLFEQQAAREKENGHGNGNVRAANAGR